MSDSKETILNRMMNRIDSSYDKSVGTFFYDAIMPVAIELEKISKQADNILNIGFVDTAIGKELDRIANEVGIVRKQAVKSTGYVTVGGVNGSNIVAGEKVASEDINFIFIEDKKIENDEVDVLVACELVGTAGNIPAGAIKYFPKTLQGLKKVTNKKAFDNGYDEEKDDSLRKRYYAKVRTSATSGNKYHYEQWALEVPGVGNAVCVPGAGDVKVIISNSNKRKADEKLIDEVQKHIQESRPLLAGKLTVSSVEEKTINIKCDVEINSSVTLDEVKNEFSKLVKDYFENKVDDTKKISIAKVQAMLVDIKGVSDCSNLRINDLDKNISLDIDEIAILGDIVLGVV